MSEEYKWTTRVQEDPETGDAILEFPDEMLDIVGWKEGDTLSWDVQDDGTIIITAVGESDGKS
jgi:hypothetical protein